jgi:tetratricopeptide (TPR) repeat protein
MKLRAKLIFSAIIFGAFLSKTPVAEAASGESLLRQGVMARDTGNETKAIKIFDSALQKDPNLADAYIERGLAKSQLFRFKSAIEDFDQAITINSKSIRAYDLRSIIYKFLGEGEKAKKDIEFAIKIVPKSSQDFAEMGSFLSSHGRNKDAIDFLNTSISMDNRNTRAYFSRAVFYEKNKQYDKAIQEYGLAIETNRNLLSAYVRRGYLNQTFLSQKTFAENDFNRAIKINPSYANTSIGYQFFFKDSKSAQKYFDQAIYLDNNNATAYFRRCYNLSLLKQYNEAIVDCKKHIEFNRENFDALDMIANNYLKLGKYQESIQYADQSVNINPLNADAFEIKGSALNMMGNYKAALLEHSKAIELDKNDAFYYEQRGRNYIGLKEYEKSILDFNQAINLKPSNYNLYKMRGQVNAAINYMDKALQDYEKALALLKKSDSSKDKKDLELWISNIKSYQKAKFSLILWCTIALVLVYFAYVLIKKQNKDNKDKNSRNLQS